MENGTVMGRGRRFCEKLLPRGPQAGAVAARAERRAKRRLQTRACAGIAADEYHA
jgi:hypothetical protein